MLTFRYQPLQYGNSIRILVLHPSLNDSDPITCTIQHARLSDASLEFEAVSYTWGNNTQTRAIYFNNGTRELHVRQNCHSALWYLRNKYEDRLLWIDAISINQNNLQERARQVRIMDEIFDRASHVVVIIRERNASHLNLFEELMAAEEALVRTGRCIRDPPSDAIVQELEDFFRDPWFERVWVLQEVCAKPCVRFICGSSSFSYHSLRNLCYGYGNNTMVTKEYLPRTLKWIIDPPEEFTTPQFNLWNRLGESRNYLATDPKDKVFALRSLIGSEKSAMDPVINYAQSIEECFIAVGTFLLPVLGLRLLTAARHPHNKRMPSWIPDWSQRLPLHFFHFAVESFVTTTDQLVPYFDASNIPRHTIRSFSGVGHETRLELHVTGCRYAQIVERSQVFHFVSIEDAGIQMRKLYTSLISLRQSANVEGMSRDPAVIAHLGKPISEGEHEICMQYAHL
jgi:hypothetical protein